MMASKADKKAGVNTADSEMNSMTRLLDGVAHEKCLKTVFSANSSLVGLRARSQTHRHEQQTVSLDNVIRLMPITCCVAEWVFK
jgi:hypothetical protein